MKYITTLLLFSISFFTHSQDIVPSVNNVSNLHYDTIIWNSNNNPAQLSLIKKNSIILQYCNLYSIENLNSFNLTSNLILYKNTPFSISISNFGTDFYSTNSITLATSKKVIPNLRVGILYKHKFITSSESTSLTLWETNIGTEYKLNEKTNIGYNQLIFKQIESQSKYRFSSNIYINYILFSKLKTALNIEVNSEIYYTISPSYKIHNLCIVHGYISNKTNNMAIGSSLLLKNFFLTINCISNKFLGRTFEISFAKAW